MASDVFNLSEFLPYRLAVLSERISKRISLVYGEKYGLSLPEWRVIVHLSRCHRVSVREIHNCVNLEKPRVSRAVSRLEAAGLVVKEAGAEDHRLVEISLTKAGWKVLDGIVPEALAVEARLLGRLSEAEQETLVALMERLHGELDEDPKAVPRSRMDLAQVET
ncbi:MarR family winged helix-turn-helix transcriptional regulator [Tropicimonas sp. TH_r6]|uniref:MarR family winged helix-turn-helix transcriptional regulator n=1 Tax=Tropicimonas sp. TH_r6 TaxID=3082085 RepID=UPI002955069B|nr:MarR family winged helix-turn-helix transcriptional regulator [Tropicimonas sp. TH_r6]MDV7143642.1 MarR family winged helix-turn-helix transcriptional regulator [Tropicimonas sp. TH_r6]